MSFLKIQADLPCFFHSIPFELSAKEGNCEYNFQEFFDMTKKGTCFMKEIVGKVDMAKVCD